MIHTSFHRGTPLLIVFRDGRRVIDKYVEKTAKGFLVERLGRIAAKDVRAAAIYKGRDDRAKESLKKSK